MNPDERSALDPADVDEQRHHDWLSEAWSHLDDRYTDVLTRRLVGQGYAEIGELHGVSRQRGHQLQMSAERELLAIQVRHAPELPTQLVVVIGDHPAVPDQEVKALIQTGSGVARHALLRALGSTHPRTWSGHLYGWWTQHPGKLDLQLRELAALAPLGADELVPVAASLGLPDGLPLDDLLSGPKSPLLRHSTGWVRRNRVTRDAAYLWLRAEGSPRSVADIATATETSENTVRERMRGDDAFAQVRPEGTWCLADWRLPGADSRYSTAVDVVVEVLRDQGPLTLQQLRTECSKRYPVSAWRIDQCLSSNLVGLTADDRYDLAERGATPIEDTEPRQPPNIKATSDGTLIGVSMTVDGELLRGSGLPVHRWLTWYLGLRTAPAERHFPWENDSGDLVIRRRTSSSSVSSLRAVVHALGLVEGCKIALLIKLNPDRAALRHQCPLHSCPAAVRPG